MPNVSFAAQVDGWVRQTEARMNAVFRASVQEVVSDAQSRIPVDTGFARSSILASNKQMPSIDPAKSGAPGAWPYTGLEIALVLADTDVGQMIYIGWTAAYAMALEYGHSQQAPNGFVRLAAQNWPQIVARVTEEAKARAGVN
jgi:hypothetical protein